MTQLMTTLILETFRLNGELLRAGDQLVGGIGLTSARWQVLGAIEMAPAPLPVAHLARNMGLSRQAVQRLANDLEAQGLVTFIFNPHHSRAQLVILSKSGKVAFDRAMAMQIPWAEALAAGMTASAVKATIKVMKSIREKLQSDEKLSEGHKHVTEEHV